MMTPQQGIWEERLRRATWRSEGTMDPVVRELTAEMRRAVADAGTYQLGARTEEGVRGRSGRRRR